MAEFIKPKEVTVKSGDGEEKTFIISKFDAVFGREVAFQYPLTVLPKVGDYLANEQLMFRAMTYAAAISEDGTQMPLKTKALVNNLCPDWEMLVALEKALMEYNISFLRDGRISTFFEVLAQTILRKISETLTPSSESFSQVEKPPSTN